MRANPNYLIFAAAQQASRPNMKIANLFKDTKAPRQGERLETLLAYKNLVIERIVSSASVPPTEYVQTQDEWVAMIRGHATLEVAGETIFLESGDCLFLASGTPHTVRRVSEGALWLAVHLHSQAAP